MVGRWMIAEIIYDGKLSVAAWLILAGMTALIVGGLSWCFYRAVAATRKDAAEQLPDEV
jgi:hypothetical protein